MKLNDDELREIVECIDFTDNHLRMFGKAYKPADDRYKYEFGYLNYLIELRNKITTKLNQRDK